MSAPSNGKTSFFTGQVCAQPGRHSLKPTLKGCFYTNLVVARYGVPEQIVFVVALRRTSVGKLDKKVLRERSASLEGAPEGRKRFGNISLLSNDPHNRLDLQEVP